MEQFKQHCRRRALLYKEMSRLRRTVPSESAARQSCL